MHRFAASSVSEERGGISAGAQRPWGGSAGGVSIRSADGHLLSIQGRNAFLTTQNSRTKISVPSERDFIWRAGHERSNKG